MLRHPQTLGTVAAVLLALLSASQPPAVAQEPVASSPMAELRDPGTDLTPETVNALVSRLSDSEVRALLLERLEAVAADEGGTGGMGLAGGMQAFQDEADLIRSRIKAIGAAVTELPSVLPQALENLRDNRPTSFFFWLTAGFALMMAVGWLAEFFLP